MRHGKLNLYTIYGLRNLDNTELKEFLALLRGKPDKTDIRKLKTILEQCGALEYAKNKLLFVAQKAQDSLSKLPATDSKEILFQLISFTIERKF
ncbi:MAG: hypothetical protein EU536_04955 [Promethearchaeota archaeon]|nr:MAG: hypothetical protein EU536_04955 [Candidatus Lokiarchaeota archaeon]